MTDGGVDKTLEALRQAIRELEARGASISQDAQRRVHALTEAILASMEAGEGEPESLSGRLSRQSQEVASELRRIEALMKRKSGQED